MFDWLNKHPAAAAGVISIIAIVAISLAVLLPRLGSNDATVEPTLEYYYDLSNGQTFTHDINAIPPVLPENGATLDDGTPAGVRAAMFACGDDRNIGYIEMYTAEVKATRENLAARFGGSPNVLSPAAMREAGINEFSGLMIARPSQTPTWLSAAKYEGYSIIEQASNQPCGEGKVKRVYP